LDLIFFNDALLNQNFTKGFFVLLFLFGKRFI